MISEQNMELVKTRYLWFLTLSYVMALVLANWFEARLVLLFGLTFTAGAIIFPFTFILADVITEVYGYKFTRRAIWVGFLFNAFYLAYGHLIIYLPSPEHAMKNELFDVIMTTNVRIIMASMISYLIAEPINSYMVAKLKILFQGRRMGFRFVSSTFVASGVDSFIFTMLAFYGTMQTTHVVTLLLTMWLFKVSLEIIGLPLSIKLTKKLKQIEKIDMYDKDTNFTLFSMDDRYKHNANHYGKTP